MSPPSELTGSAKSARTTMSRRLWDLDWAAELPWEVNGVRVAAGSADEIVGFLADNHAELFPGRGADDRFFRETMTEAKRRWAADMDVFAFYLGDDLVGTFMGHPTDWSSYYIRTTAILPHVRGRRLVPFLIGQMSAVLSRFGVERVEADVPPTNAPSLGVLASQGFLVTSVVNSERWGTCLRLTKYLRPAAEAAFVRQFCSFDAGRRAPPHTINQEMRTP